LKRGDLGGEGEPGLDLKAGERLNTPEHGVGEAGVLTFPLTLALKLLLIIQVLDGVELNQVAQQRRELGHDPGEIHGRVRRDRLLNRQEVKNVPA